MSEIKVYAAQCDTLDLAAALPLLDEERRARIRSMPPHAARQHAAAGLLLLHACRTLLGEPPAAVSRDGAGRPFLPAHPEFCFSLSHSGDWALCAAGFSPIGADIQQVRPISSAVLSRFFSAEERELCRDGVDPIRIWCAKESFGKLNGSGLSRTFSVSAQDGSLFVESLPITEFSPAEGYFAAVCTTGATCAECVIVPPEEIMQSAHEPYA
jgi:4'-phosphopantetheinyl transferase